MMISDPTKCDGLKVFKVRGGAEGRFCWRAESVVWVRQHWMRRAHLCTCDDSCPGCRWNGARSVGFLAVTSVYGQAGVIEVSPSAVARFHGLVGLENSGRACSPLGFWFTAARRGNKCPLVIEPDGEVADVEAVGVERVVRAIACLYRLPRPHDGEGIEEFFERSKVVLRAHLADAVEGEKILSRSGRSSRGS